MKNTLQVTENAAISMTSLEIAELTGKRHDSVKRTIEILSQETDKRPAVIQLPHSVEVKNHLGQSVTQYVFSGEQGKLDSITITAQLCPEFTAAIVKRWQELENQVRLPALTDHSQVLVEINTRLAKIEETQVPRRGQQSTEGWNNHHKRDLARVQAEIRSLKSEIKSSPPTPTAEHSQRIYLKRLIQQELVLEELIQRNGQYHALWLTHRSWADQVRLLSDRARRLEDCADPELADDLTNLFSSFFSPIEMES